MTIEWALGVIGEIAVRLKEREAKRNQVRRLFSRGGGLSDREKQKIRMLHAERGGMLGVGAGALAGRALGATAAMRAISPKGMDLYLQKKAEIRRTVYHGSPQSLKRLEPRDDHGDPGVGARVFATPDKEFALAYAGGKWGDRDINQAGRGGGKTPVQWVLTEMRPEAFDEVYKGKRGYIHHLPAEAFRREPTLGSRYEVVTSQGVHPTQIEEIPDALRALMAQRNVKLERFDTKNLSYQRAIKRMNKRMARMEDPSKYLSWVAETNPELARELVRVRGGA